MPWQIVVLKGYFDLMKTDLLLAVGHGVVILTILNILCRVF
jgi:hypothetical protein